jgi:hypothetical protein
MYRAGKANGCRDDNTSTGGPIVSEGHEDRRTRETLKIEEPLSHGVKSRLAYSQPRAGTQSTASTAVREEKNARGTQEIFRDL